MKPIVLIGLPGAGKSTVAHLLAAQLGLPRYDSDEEIEKECGKPIREIFEAEGETAFRQMETRCIAALLQKGACVLAVGGGAVLYNSTLLHENALVIYLKRSVEHILAELDRSNRPLLQAAGNLERLYTQRRALYEACCHITVENNGTPLAACQKIREELA